MSARADMLLAHTEGMISTVTFRSCPAVEAALLSPALVPPPRPATLSPGPTAGLRDAMARFAQGENHTTRRAQVVDLIDSLDPVAITRQASAATAARLRGQPVDVISGLAHVVPTEVLLEALGGADDSSTSIRDVSLLAAVIGRGHPSDIASDAAVVRLSHRFASHQCGPIAVQSMLYQNHDATSALLIETLDAATHGRLRRSAVTRTLRVATSATRVADTDVCQGALVTLDLAESGFEYGLGAHMCPGRSLAEAIVAGIMAAITTGGYRVLSDAVERDVTDRPTTFPMEPGR